MKLIYTLLTTLLFYLPATAQDDATYYRLTNQANTYYYGGDYKRCAETLEAAIAIKGDKAGYKERFNAACAWAKAGDADKAFKHLNYLAGALMEDPQGYMGKDHLDPTFYSDKDFDSLRDDLRWKKFLARLNRKRPSLAIRLDMIYRNDQEYRQQIEEVEKTYGHDSKELKKLWEVINRNDSLNLIAVEQIIEKYNGWPPLDSTKARGSSAMFLVIQHSDKATQEKYIPLIRQAVKDGKVKGSQLAMLEDRLALAQGKRQIYGTQVMRMGDEDWFVQPLEDPDHVDERRKSVGLNTLRFYLKYFDIQWDVEAYKKQLPAIEEKMRKAGWGK